MGNGTRIALLLAVVAACKAADKRPPRQETRKIEPIPSEKPPIQDRSRFTFEYQRKWREEDAARRRAEKEKSEQEAQARERERRHSRLAVQSYELLRIERIQWDIICKSDEETRPPVEQIRSAYKRLHDLHVAGVHEDEQRLLRVQLARMMRERAEWRPRVEVARRMRSRLDTYDVDEEGTLTREILKAKAKGFQREAEAEVAELGPAATARAQKLSKWFEAHLADPAPWGEWEEPAR